MAALESLLPEEIEEHVHLNHARLKTFVALKQEIILLLEAKAGARYQVDEPVPMDTSALYRDGGKDGGKGKGKSKGKKGDSNPQQQHQTKILKDKDKPEVQCYDLQLQQMGPQEIGVLAPRRWSCWRQAYRRKGQRKGQRKEQSSWELRREQARGSKQLGGSGHWSRGAPRDPAGSFGLALSEFRHRRRSDSPTEQLSRTP
eukprot:689667-Amphidinium_carterae.1